MIGLDTNVLIRYFVQDDEAQSALATKIIEETLSADNRGFISMITVVEISWVLLARYKIPKEELCDLLRMILETKQFAVENPDACYRALKTYQNGNGDFSDALIFCLSRDAGCLKMLTFDKKARSVGMQLLVA
jgi:predicted nucleic-acid-binding protein